MITIQELLKSRGLDDTKKIKLVRHIDEAKFNDEHHQAEPYFQYNNKSKKTIDYIVSFIKEKGTLARFVRISKILDVKINPNSKNNKFTYTFEEVMGFEDLKNNVVIDWGGGVANPYHWFENPKEIKEINTDREGKLFEDKLNAAKQLSSAENITLISSYPEYPTKIITQSSSYNRNPHVVVEVLRRAQGKCEYCLKTAPFIKIANKEPYLEVHHILPLSENGKDTVENAIALCPNCHRNAHHGGLKIINKQ
jgi:hypothetical protein